MKAKEAKEILRAGAAWANWSADQKKAIQTAYVALCDVETIKGFCIDCDADERSIQPYEILDLLSAGVEE